MALAFSSPSLEGDSLVPLLVKTSEVPSLTAGPGEDSGNNREWSSTG